MIKDDVKLGEVIDFLNSLLNLDKNAVTALFSARTYCNNKIGAHPTVQIQEEPFSNILAFDENDNMLHYTVGILGILNGLFGVFEEGSYTGCGPITAIWDEKEELLLGFKKTIE